VNTRAGDVAQMWAARMAEKTPHPHSRLVMCADRVRELLRSYIRPEPDIDLVLAIATLAVEHAAHRNVSLWRAVSVVWKEQDVHRGVRGRRVGHSSGETAQTEEVKSR